MAGRVLMTIGVLLALVGPARAAAPWDTYSTKEPGSVVADGERWAVAPISPFAIAVFDDRDPEAGWKRVDLGSGCEWSGVVRAGEALIGCGESPPELLDLSTYYRKEVPALDPHLTDYRPAIALGERWLTRKRGNVIDYVRLHTGKVRTVDKPGLNADLDYDGLARPLCAPVRRSDQAPVLVAGRHVLRVDAGVLQDWRCGTPRPRSLLTCGAAGCGAQIGAGIVTASDGGDAVAIRLRDGARQAVPAPPASTVAHTRRYLFYSGHEGASQTIGVAPLTVGARRRWALAPAGYPLASDGRRWAATGGDLGSSMRVFDDRAPGWRRIALPLRCTFNGGIGGGLASILCGGDYGNRLGLVDLVTGAISYLPGYEPYVNPFDRGYEGFGLGRRWLAAAYSEYHASGNVYVNIVDGRQVAVEGARRGPDLDADEVDQPLCDPVRRGTFLNLGSYDSERLSEPIERDGGWIVTRRHDGKELIAWHCGRPRPRRLLDCRRDGGCFTAHAGSRVVTYDDVNRVTIAPLNGAPRRSIRYPAGMGTHRTSAVVHTQHYILASKDAQVGTVRYR